jgi:predicted ATPase/class 3 adenylate cyclase
VTFVFTDLEGSTRLWEEFPDAMRRALARHDELLRTAIMEHNGQVVKTTGDGVHAVFGSAHDALAAAATAQRAISEESWETPGPLRVRIGIHTGDAELRDQDYYGPAVNRAARLMAAAQGGQILVSLATEELARDALDDGLSFIDLGEHRLRDLARPERVFQVTGPGLPTDFGPPTWLDSLPGNLPAQVTSFVGREQSVVDIADALREVPLVTITGTGGVGKTRLALQTAVQVIEDYRDGAWLCELGVAGDDEEAIQVVATALGVTPRPGMSLESSIVEFLRSKQLLLVLDNCEHLLNAAGRFAEGVMRACPEVRMLATSREGLAVDGEQMRPLRSLSLPDPSDPPDVVAASDAATLFVDRARAARPGFDLDATNAPAITEICRRLDGIPLAIELAAARVVSMNPGEIAALVDERFRLLTGGRRTAVERHQTLRATVDWSYSLLSEAEQRVFARLSVFSGSFAAADATAVVTGDGIDTWDVIELIGSLVAKSMLTTDEAPDGTTRYRQLETLRQYARDRLDDLGDPDVWRRRHAEHYAEFAEEVGAGLMGEDELAWRPRAMAELDNLRSAVSWSLDCEDPDERELGVRIVAGLSYEANSGEALEVGSWAERALPIVERTTPERRAAVVSAAAWNALLAGDFDLARERSEAVLREDVVGFVHAVAHIQLAYVASIEGDYDRVMATLAEGLTASDARPDLGDAAQTRALLLVAMSGMQITGGHNSESAQADASEAVAAAYESGHPTAIANALFVSGLSRWRAEPEVAAPLLDESIALVRAGANSIVYPMMLAIRALVDTQGGDAPGAYAALHEAITCAHDKGDIPALVGSLDYGIQVWAQFGDSEVAATIGGAIAGPLGAIGGLVYEVPYREGALQQARAALGADAFDAAAARGAVMSLDDLVACAIAAATVS